MRARGASYGRRPDASVAAVSAPAWTSRETTCRADVRGSVSAPAEVWDRGGLLGPYPLVAPIGSPVQCRFPRWAGRVELLRRERA